MTGPQAEKRVARLEMTISDHAKRVSMLEMKMNFALRLAGLIGGAAVTTLVAIMITKVYG